MADQARSLAYSQQLQEVLVELLRAEAGDLGELWRDCLPLRVPR